MLVLSRKLGEKIRIGDEIEIEVLNIRGSRIRLGISCPLDFSITRSDLIPQALPKEVELWTESTCLSEFQSAGI